MDPTPTPTPTPSSTSGDPGIIARLATQRSKFRSAVGALTVERNTLRDELARLKVENSSLAVRADTSASAKRVAELEGQIRDGKHRAAFAKAAKAKGATEGSYDDLYQLSGYKAATDEIDETAIGALIDEQKTARPYLFGGAATTPTAPPTGTPIKPGPGGGQGPRVEAPGMIVSQDDPRLSDVKWVMNNYDAVVKQAQDRVSRGEV